MKLLQQHKFHKCLDWVVFLFAMIVLFVSCTGNNNRSVDIPLNSKDSMWLAFLQAMETHDTGYLIQHSSDSIQCADCKIEPANKEENYKAAIVYQHHIDKLMHIESLKQLKYEITETDGRLQVIYSIKSKEAKEGTYSLIFLFQRVSAGFLFKGMIVN